MPPKSGKLQREEEAATAERAALRAAAENAPPAKVYAPGETIPVKKIKTFNDFVAILQFRIETTAIIVEGKEAYRNEGMVVGVGPGLPNGNGLRCPSQLNVGDVVAFYGNPTITLNPASGIFAGQKIVIVPERAILCGLNPVPFKVVEPAEAPANG